MASFYAADESGNIFEYAYPSGGTPASTLTVAGEPYGTAVIATQYPGSSQ